MTETINLSHIWVEGAWIDEHGSSTIQLTAERGKTSDHCRPRIKIVLNNCCQIGTLVGAVMKAHQSEVNRVIDNRDWEAENIAENIGSDDD